MVARYCLSCLVMDAGLSAKWMSATSVRATELPLGVWRVIVSI